MRSRPTEPDCRCLDPRIEEFSIASSSDADSVPGRGSSMERAAHDHNVTRVVCKVELPTALSEAIE